MAITYPLPLPTVTGFRASELQPQTVVGMNRSPFTGSQQIYPWPAQWLQFMIELPPMRETSAAIWSAFFMALNGPEGTFYLGPSIRKTPTNAVSQLASVGSGAVANSTTLPVQLAVNSLSIGDWLSVGAINLLTYSNSIANAAWTKSATTATDNAVANPGDGTTTAGTLLETATTAAHEVSQAVALPARPHCFSIFLKANGRTTASLFITKSGSSINAIYDLSSGVATLGFALGDTGTCGMFDAGGGWWRCWLTCNEGASSSAVKFGPGGGVSYAGDITKGVSWYGAQVNHGLTPMGYLGTTSAAATQSPRLHRVVQVNSLTSVEVFPRLRSAYASGTPITTRSPVGLFRLAGMVSEGYDSRKICNGMSFTAFEDIT